MNCSLNPFTLLLMRWNFWQRESIKSFLLSSSSTASCNISRRNWNVSSCNSVYFRNHFPILWKAFKLEICVRRRSNIRFVEHFSISHTKRLRTNFRNVIEKTLSWHRGPPPTFLTSHTGGCKEMKTILHKGASFLQLPSDSASVSLLTPTPRHWPSPSCHVLGNYQILLDSKSGIMCYNNCNLFISLRI